ncbi:MAG: hypothetical protein K0S39_1240 [Paenibacillus sp.]|jgi:AraC-like DNA-binding protein|nr:hypothetical protein [Paenibacillus sp.]
MTSYGFRYADGTPEHLYYMVTIGMDSVSTPEYRWNGLEREGPGLLFQYTLSGEGRLETDGTRYPVPKNHGFFVSIPSAHCYWYEPDSGQAVPWEFIWIKIHGHDSASFWERYIRHFGHVAGIHPEADVIRLLKKLLHDTANKTLGDKYQTSLRLYEWLLAVYREWKSEHQDRTQEAGIPQSVARVKEWLNDHYREPDIGLDDAAAIAGISKYHLCKIFQASLGVTPMSYVRHLRLEESARLLRHTGTAVTDIAALAGFSNVSYFGKVFRQVVGVSPSQFREGEGEADFSNLRIL